VRDTIEMRREVKDTSRTVDEREREIKYPEVLPLGAQRKRKFTEKEG